MELDLYSVGQKIFSFNLIFSIISSFIAIGIAVGGAPSEIVGLPLFAPAGFFYKLAIQQVASLPVNVTNSSNIVSNTSWVISDISGFTYAVSAASSIAIVASILAYIFVGMSLFAATVIVIMPNELKFLVIPLVFLFSFFQLALLYYLFLKIKELLSPVLVKI
jgi:hypothetical protein